MIDMRSGEFVFVQARAVLLATGGGPTMYRYHTPSGDKSCDGLAMALRAGLAAARHGDGAVPPDRTARRHRHAHDRHGARRRAARRRRLPAQRRAASASWATTTRAPNARRATSSRARSTPRCAPAAPRPTAASTSQWRTSARTRCARQFKGMVERCADCGFDLAGGLVEVVPTAHYMMGGVRLRAATARPRCRACSPPARTPAACTARTASAATASPTPPCSAASPATTMAAWVRDEGAWREPDEAAIDAQRSPAASAVRRKRERGDLERVARGALRD